MNLRIKPTLIRIKAASEAYYCEQGASCGKWPETNGMRIDHLIPAKMKEPNMSKLKYNRSLKRVKKYLRKAQPHLYKAFKAAEEGIGKRPTDARETAADPLFSELVGVGQKAEYAWLYVEEGLRFVIQYPSKPEHWPHAHWPEDEIDDSNPSKERN